MGFQYLLLNRRPPALWPAASGHHLGAPDEEARIDTQGPANQAEHHDCANPNAAAGYGDAASILNPRALRQFVEAHGLPHRFVTFHDICNANVGSRRDCTPARIQNI